MIESILIVEHDADALARLQLACACLDVCCYVTRSTPAALHYCLGRSLQLNRDTHPLPRLILIDLQLPDISGLELLRWLKQQADWQDIPVVVLSDCLDAQSASAQALGAIVLLKAESSWQIATVVQQTLDAVPSG